MTRKTTILIMSILATIMISPFSIMPNANADSIGEIQVWTGSTSAIPGDFLLADGSTISRTTYSDLFAVIGTTFGAGDGSTTFNIPDLVEKFPRGATNDATRGNTGGESEHTLTIAELPSHNHPNKLAISTLAGVDSTIVSTQATNNQSLNPTTTPLLSNGSTGSNAPHENKPPYLDIHYIIRHAESSSGSQSQIDTNTTNIASMNSTVIQLTSDITTLQSQITSMNATLNTLDSEVSVIDTLVDYIDTFLNGIFINYEP